MGRWNSAGRRQRRTVEDEPGRMPSIIEPELATLVSRAPAAGDWSYEIKFDGYRMLARIENGDVKLITRNGHDWTSRMARLLRRSKPFRLTTPRSTGRSWYSTLQASRISAPCKMPLTGAAQRLSCSFLM
jgi:hypothetical protein